MADGEGGRATPAGAGKRIGDPDVVGHNASGQLHAEILPTDVASSTDDCGMWSCIG
jgi:hypothetical protein